MCGVFGVFGHPEASNLTYLGLHALQHRGQESAGIVTSDGAQLTLHRGMGHVAEIFNPEQIARLQGPYAIGHVRYSTAGGSSLKNAQPIAVDYSKGSIAVGHNGNLTNAETLREKLEERGSIFQTSSDTEVIVHLIAKSHQRLLEDRVADALSQVQGAYSLLCLAERAMIAVRDPRGIRPLCLGRLDAGKGAYVVSSEPTGFELIGADFVREIEPGEMLVIDATGLHSSWPFPKAPSRACIFEHVYFARPDSFLHNISVYEARKSLGRALAQEAPVDADVVVPVPDSGIPATIGYAQASGIPFELGLVRSHYVGRTFIEPQQSIRHFGVRLKLSPVLRVLQGKRVVVVDDSIVRGTTSRKIVRMLRDAGASEVHMRISSPPIRWPCYYGIDTPNRQELIAARHAVEEINEFITSDSLAYLSLGSMLDAVKRAEYIPPEQAAKLQANGGSASGSGDAIRAGRPSDHHLPMLQQDETFCHACFSGDYPIAYTKPARSRQMRLLDV